MLRLLITASFISSSSAAAAKAKATAAAAIVQATAEEATSSQKQAHWRSKKTPLDQHTHQTFHAAGE
jgi:hypothetical protein